MQVHVQILMPSNNPSGKYLSGTVMPWRPMLPISVHKLIPFGNVFCASMSAACGATTRSAKLDTCSLNSSTGILGSLDSSCNFVATSRDTEFDDIAGHQARSSNSRGQ